MKKKPPTHSPLIPGDVALVTAQAVDLLAQGLADDGTPHTVLSATQLVLAQREAAKLPLPSPQELDEALAYVQAQREQEA